MLLMFFIPNAYERQLADIRKHPCISLVPGSFASHLFRWFATYHSYLAVIYIGRFWNLLYRELFFTVCYLLEQVKKTALDRVVVMVGTGNLVPDVFSSIGFEQFVI